MQFTLCTVVIISTMLGETRPQRTALDSLNTFVKNSIYAIMGHTGSIQRMRNPRKLGPHLNESTSFPCQPSPPYRSEERPTSVHSLRPGDIDVIAAIGDSLTAANGAAATAIYHVAVENRGLSWAMGGQATWRQILTLPNILKVFNPQLVGYSLGDSSTIHKDSQFNVAEGGSMSRDMPYMAKILVNRIKSDKRVDFYKDWKLVTFMIGANDFCSDICYHANPARTAEIHRKNIIKTLDYLRDNLPRTIVNVVAPPSMEILMGFSGHSPFCKMFRVVTCPCIFGKANDGKREKLLPIMRRWQEVDEEVCTDERYKKSDEFAVVLQPFITNLIFPERTTSRGVNETDWSFLSEDCFHFSQKAYARAANALWNNMLEPVGRKSTDWGDVFHKFICPSMESPYISTWKNSGDTADTRQILPYPRAPTRRHS